MDQTRGIRTSHWYVHYRCDFINSHSFNNCITVSCHAETACSLQLPLSWLISATRFPLEGAVEGQVHGLQWPTRCHHGLNTKLNIYRASHVRVKSVIVVVSLALAVSIRTVCHPRRWCIRYHHQTLLTWLSRGALWRTISAILATAICLPVGDVVDCLPDLA